MASVVTSLLGGNLLDGVSKVIDSIRGKSPEDAAKLQQLQLQYAAEFQQAQVELQKTQIQAQVQTVQAQTDTNKAEATNTSAFVAGWRPFVGWICGVGLAFALIIAPLCSWIAALEGKPIAFPPLDTGTLLTLLLGMLGLGAMRTVEKVNGVNSGH